MHVTGGTHKHGAFSELVTSSWTRQVLELHLDSWIHNRCRRSRGCRDIHMFTWLGLTCRICRVHRHDRISSLSRHCLATSSAWLRNKTYVTTMMRVQWTWDWQTKVTLQEPVEDFLLTVKAWIVMELCSRHGRSGHHLPNLASVFSSCRQNNSRTPSAKHWSMTIFAALAEFFLLFGINKTSGQKHLHHGLSSFTARTRRSALSAGVSSPRSTSWT